MLLALLLPVAAGVLAGLFLSAGNVLALVLYIVVGLMLGVLLLLIVLGRKAERAAYSQIEGQPGAVGAVMKSGLRRSWRAAEMPVAVQGRSQAAVYRAVGKGGVVRDPGIHARVCDEVAAWLVGQGWSVEGVVESPITGPEGNVEFLIAAHAGDVPIIVDPQSAPDP